jgi:hypothetical protein
MLGNKLADGRDKIMGDFHYGVVLFHECRFILGHGFFRRLLFIVREDTLNSVFVPFRGKFTLAHICLLRLRLTRELSRPSRASHRPFGSARAHPWGARMSLSLMGDPFDCIVITQTLL